MFKAARAGLLYRAIIRYFEKLALEDPSSMGRADSLPYPGRAGLPPEHYAVWVERIMKARQEHGRGYMKPLLAEHPGETRSNVLRKLGRAEQFGL